MAIDPTQINTVQVKDLPPAELNPENNFAHEVGDTLSRATIQQLIDMVKTQSLGAKYELKYLRTPTGSTYITDNFDMTAGAGQGLGKSGGLWPGWAICNGNNGTDNLDGLTLIGFGADYPTVGFTLGERNHTLSINEIPSISPINGSYFKKGTGGGGTTGLTVADNGINNFDPGELIKPFGGGQAHNNMQPSFVILVIMKIV